MTHRLFHTTFTATATAILSIVLATSCAEKRDEAQVAANTAKIYYDSLIAGRCDVFVDGTFLPDSIPSAYREQLETNAKMFLHSQTEAHKGISGVSIASCVADSTATNANVFLFLHFNDSTSEQVVVPMIRHEGVWYMR